MERPNTMPDESHVVRMVEQLLGEVRSLVGVVIGDGKEPGMAENVRTNRASIDALDAAFEVLKKTVETTLSQPVKLEETKWRVYGRWAEVVGLIVAVVLSLSNAMGWIP